MRVLVTVICMVAWVALPGCDATTSGVQAPSQSPFPYNPRW